FIGEQGEEVASAEPAGDGQAAAPAPEPAAAVTERAEPEPAPAPQTSRANGRVKASPLARRIARERGIDIAQLHGTGPDGRIVAEDVERAAQAPAAAAAPAAVPVVTPGEVGTRPLTSIRRTIARRLTEAWTVPVFQLTISVDMTRANALLAKLRE